MKKLILGSFLSAIAMFVFGAIFWMSPMGSVGIKKSLNDQVAQEVLKINFPETGSYFVPSNQDHSEEAVKLMTHGPIATVHITHSGASAMDPMSMIKGFFHGWLVIFLAGFVLVKTAPNSDCYRCRVMFFTMLGVIVSVFADGSDIIWWYVPAALPLVKGTYTILTFLLAGLVMAKFTGTAKSKP